MFSDFLSQSKLGSIGKTYKYSKQMNFKKFAKMRFLSFTLASK